MSRPLTQPRRETGRQGPRPWPTVDARELGGVCCGHQATKAQRGGKGASVRGWMWPDRLGCEHSHSVAAHAGLPGRSPFCLVSWANEGELLFQKRPCLTLESHDRLAYLRPVLSRGQVTHPTALGLKKFPVAELAQLDSARAAVRA